MGCPGKKNPVLFIIRERGIILLQNVYFFIVIFFLVS